MTIINGLLILLVLDAVNSSSTVRHQIASIQAVPPSVSLSPISDKQNTGNFININPILTSSLLQALVEESENKKRVQRSIDKYTGLTQERFDAISTRYKEFQRVCHDATTKPIVVFDKMSEKSLKELYLNREVSKELQKKKEEDMKKAAQVEDEGKVEAKEVKTETQDDQQSTETEK